MNRFPTGIGALAPMLFSALLLSGCGSGEAPSGEALDSPVSAAATDQDKDNTAQANLNLLLARQAMPGKPIYDAACASCHEGAVKKAPHRDMIGLMPPEAILRSMEEGIMQAEASGLTPDERVQVAEFLAGVAMGAVAATDLPACGDEVPPPDFSTAPDVINWGLEPTNTRHIPAAKAGLSAEQLPALEPRMAIRFPSANRARSQPTFAGSAILVGSHSGKVYGLDKESGCAHWSFQASSEVRTGIVFGRLAGDQEAALTVAFFGDLLGHVYAVNASTGEELWRQRADDHPNTTITGTPSLHEGVLYTPVSSLEVNLGLDPYYECCTFRGSVAAYDAATGELLWQTFTIDELAVVQYQNRAETNMWGPSGAVIWNSPAIDAKRNQLYVATGENMSSPATLTSDAIFAMALDDGAVNWVFQATANDVWNTACDTENDHSCPPEGGPDFDFGAATMLLTASDGRELVIGGQKSGIVHAVNPDDGSVVWQTRVGRGGIQGGVHFGMAAAGDRLFVPMSDMADGREYDTPDRPGMHALDIRTGEILWSSLNPDACKGRDFCHPGVSQAVTAANGVVYAGAMDGVLRAHDVETGAVLWELDTTQEFTTITGETTHGGSFGGAAGPIIHQGELALSSGYGIYNHMAGNLLLVLSASEPTSP
ncbi:MAG: PQQ-binding-like beta-propeller repeat protein [Gammaproteobacteria bacterium]|nr:PQQ-binding-like beta-propeller repeat protein [Gammaproteobacteria bacterium]MYE52054.1 PQQ-binding-like beta-propeller repeat protein [Gammaproteobacteria bacterium]